MIALATEADVSIGLSGVHLTGLTARALNGYDNFEEALTFLLAGSGLDFEKIDATTYRIFELPTAKVPAKTELLPLELTPIEEITITASKRAEALQSAPFAASVIKGAPLADFGLRSSNAAATFAPGLTTTQQGPGANKYFVRGMSDSAFAGNTQSAVGVYIDDTRAVFNAPDPNLRLVDMARVEVIRGPQGTLYGAGSIGGLVRVVTNAPVFEKYESQISAEGTFGASVGASGGVEAMLNIPVGQTVALRGVAYGQHDGGYIKNTLLNESHVNSADTTGARLAGRALLGQNWTIGTGIIWQSLRSRDSQYYDQAMPKFSRGNLLHEPSNNEFLDVNLTVNGDLGWADLISSTAWIAQDVDLALDASLALPSLAGLPPEPTLYTKTNRYRTINHETRLVSTPDRRFQWLAGAFYSRRRDSSVAHIDLLSKGPAGIFYSKNRHDSGTEMALFGEVTFGLSERLSVTSGLRAYRGTVYAVANNADIIDIGPSMAVGRHVKTGITPKATLAYHLTPNHLLYAEAAQGFRLGGVNISSPIANPVVRREGPPLTVRNFNSDTLWNFEVGAKSAWFDDRLNLNIAGFHTIWSNVQADLARSNGLLFTANLGKVHNNGFEIEATFVPNAHFRAFANFSWSDPELTESKANIAAATANHLPVLPELSASIGGQYQRQIAPGYLGYINIKSDIIGSARLVNTPNSASITDSYQVLSARAGLEHDPWRLSLYVDNAFNVSSNTYAFGNSFSFEHISQITPLRPRTIGLRITWTH